jgi:hypothetical protein
MLIAQQKRKENIVEYLIYMWQVEDLVRACRFDADEIDSRIISHYEQPETVKEEIRQWYRELANMMRMEGVMEQGHLRIHRNVLIELTDLHLRLLKSPQESVYRAFYYDTLPAIVQLRSKSGEKETGEPETCLTALYGYLMLKMQRKEISVETAKAIRQISHLLAFLAARFREKEDGHYV